MRENQATPSKSSVPPLDRHPDQSQHSSKKTLFDLIQTVHCSHQRSLNQIKSEQKSH